MDGKVAEKPGQRVRDDADVRVDDPASGYVSRAALKLVAGLDAFGFDPVGRDALDLGASTGGFTQVLLERGATRVSAIDVGHGQLAPSLRGDPRVVLVEGLNARDLSMAHVGGAIQAIVCDVSFISLRLALPPALALANPEAWLVTLVKPQFEVGREAIGKGGLADAEAGKKAARTASEWVERAGWTVRGVIPSPITGADGNREFLLGATKRGHG